MMNNFNIQSGTLPPPAPMNPQVQVIMNQLQNHIIASVNEKMMPLAEIVNEVKGRTLQIEQVLEAVIRKISDKNEPVSDNQLFDPEERRILILLSSGLYDKKDAKLMWEKHQKSKIQVDEDVNKDGV